MCAWLFLLLPQCASGVDYATGRPTLNHYALSEDIELGERLATLLLASSEVLGHPANPDHPSTYAVWRVAARILAVPSNRARMPPLPWEVNVIAASGANAWSFPGGQILVLSGLLDSGRIRDEDELAAIVGHELAHAAARHLTEKRTIEDLRSWTGVLGKFFGPRIVALANPDAPAATIRAIESETVEFDRSQELEADIIGLELMARAGYDPTRAAAIWSRWPDVDPRQETQTHPTSTTRIEELNRHAPVAQWLARRAGNPPAPEAARPRWFWQPDAPPATTATVSLGDRGVLPNGARLQERTVRPPARLLAIRASLRSGPTGEAPRASVVLTADRDLFEDRLPFSAVLTIERHDRDRTIAYARQLAFQAPLERGETEMRVALPRLSSGRYLLRVRAAVGALETGLSRRFDVAPGRRPRDVAASRTQGMAAILSSCGLGEQRVWQRRSSPACPRASRWRFPIRRVP